MYTRRNYSIPVMLSWTRRYIYRFVLLSTIPVVLYDVLGIRWLNLPWLPIGLVGTAVAFIIGFKNNASYGRLWEARKIYGGIVNASRSLAIMLNDFITNDHADQARTESELFTIRKRMILRHVAWMTCLRHALRAKKPWETSILNTSDIEYMKKIEIREYTVPLKEELEGYLAPEELQDVMGHRNKQGACLKHQSRELRELQQSGLIEDFRHMELQKMLVEFFTLQGKAERIKNFPYPRQFATLNLFFVWLFVTTIPFGLIGEFDEIGRALLERGMSDAILPTAVSEWVAARFVWFTIPFSIVIAWIFVTMERIGEVSENPFEGIGNDVPITTMSRAIEIDIRQLIGDSRDELPPPIEPMFDTQM